MRTLLLATLLLLGAPRCGDDETGESEAEAEAEAEAEGDLECATCGSTEECPANYVCACLDCEWCTPQCLPCGEGGC